MLPSHLLSGAASFLRKKHVGLPPGSVVFIGEEKTEPVQFSVIDYTADRLDETDVETVDDVLPYRDSPTTTWINVNGVHDEEIIRTIGDHFGLHPLIQEDIAHTGQRPKLETYDDNVYIVSKMLYHDDQEDHLRAEQVSFVLGGNYLISFQEDSGDVFEPVRERLRKGRGRIRGAGTDYLTYALIDVIVDHYFVILEELGGRTEEIEDEVLDDPQPETQERINDLRRDLIFMRRMTWPVRELLSQLQRLDSPLWEDDTHPFVRDTYDHAVQVLDLVESLRDVVGGLTDLYMTSLSNRMNEIMKVLTIIGTIFIPLTFIAGIYGMNFEYMPELTVWYGYPVAMTGMGVIAVVLLVYFRQKEWI
ncbi:magnesium and cobalt transport protein CorA [Salinibacter sp. 10B]|uniref:magnesium/cobalt transporter CorA n=1 Tax=Salinibacter sp. 10B TaxID=1923971 RepID=UPI000CF3E9EE|nr:magnesium/cobalt transporter CorA [Salinibacter sp. 10B]PQJ34701.1 magnesium and cobalt transport protein CorA [Salinibacter sp. 10B]